MLTVNNLNVGYGQSRVIHDLSFTVANEEILAIMGRNGMGKTTLLKSIIGILPAKSGSIKLGDQELTVPSALRTCPRGHRLRAARPHDFSHADGARKHRHRRARNDPEENLG